MPTGEKIRYRSLTVAQREELAEANRIYYPPTNGLHICGSDDEQNAAITLGAWSMQPAEARTSFQALKEEFAVMDGDHDVIVDLFIAGNVEEDFGMRRQMIEPLMRSLA
jgi:hypothetical protein